MNKTMIKDMKAHLRSNGIRPTVHRLQIAKFVLTEADHPTADQVRDWAEERLPTVSKATIYNTLNEFVNAGLLREFRSPYSKKTIFDRNTFDHYHFLDTKTGDIYDVDPKSIKVNATLPQQFNVEGLDIIFRGTSA